MKGMSTDSEISDGNRNPQKHPNYARRQTALQHLDVSAIQNGYHTVISELTEKIVKKWDISVANQMADHRS